MYIKVHIVCFSHLVVEVGFTLEHLLCSLDVEQDVAEGADGVLVAPHHHVSKTHVVVGGDLAGRNTRVHVLQNTKGYNI